MSTRICVVSACCAVSMVVAQMPAPVTAASQNPAPSPSAPPAQAAGCRVTGRVLSGADPLPGAAVVVMVGDKVRAATSSGLDGKFTIIFGPNATYHVTAELSAFGKVERDVTMGAVPCDTTLDFQLSLRPRTEPLPQAENAPAAASPKPAATDAAPASAIQAAPASAAPAATTASAQPAGRGGRAQGAGGRGQAAGRGAPAGQADARFQQLNVEEDASGSAAVESAAPADSSADVARFLPQGFTLQNAQADAVAINGSTDALNIDRSAMNDRMVAINGGQFDPASGQFAQGFGPQGGPGGDNAQGAGGRGAGGDGGGRGGPGGGRGGPGGGGFVLGGRGGRGQSQFQGNANYTYGGSALDATNLQPRNGSIQPVSSLPFNRNNYGATFGGPVKLPGIYDDTNRRTSFQLNYSGNHSTQLQDGYLTVPDLAMRQCVTDPSLPCDFSASPVKLINPATGQPFAGNQIPASAIDPSARALLGYVPLPNVPDTTAAIGNNFHNAATTLSSSKSFSLRVTQNLSPTVAAPGRGGRGGAGGRGAGGGPVGRGGAGGRAGRGLNIMLNAQVQYRENDGQQFNVVPGFGSGTKSVTWTVPVSLNISRGRTVQTFSVQVNKSNSGAQNPFTANTNAATLAGVNYPAGDLISTAPLNFGVPNLSFASFSNLNLRLPAANLRNESRITASYNLSHPFGKHQVRIGADFRRDASLTQSNSNARGSFTFTGLYTTNGAQAARGTYADFADFLIGLPQQATLQAGGNTQLRENAFDVYIDDNWQAASKLTLSLGLRYELNLPYVEASGQMANLAVTPGFTAAQVVCAITVPGVCSANSSLLGTSFPTALVNTDSNNIGPRLGVAYRMAPNTILRGGYSITYNNGSYATIARSLVGQPPFAFTATNIGSLGSPITIANGLANAQATTTNNYGVDPGYALGMIQTWNGTVTRDLTRNWTVTLGYTGTKGTDLDLLRAPNRNPDGTLRIADVQPFIWESSGAHSILQLGNFQLTRRYAKGVSGSINYTLAKSMDNASSLGAGGAVVAQNDHDLDAEWALSNFDQRHQVSANVFYELPFGVGRKWLTNGGALAAVVGEWSASLNFSAHSGNPYTARIIGATTSVANGTSNSLRADLSGAVGVPDPSLGEFFNTAAFSPPPLGQYGNSPRNVVIGPGGHVTNAQFSRDMRLSQTRAMTVQINVNNLFNTIQWTTIDTNVNSNTFGQVTRFAPMRTLTASLRFRF